MKTNYESSFKYYLIMLFLNSFVDLGHKITIQNTVFKVYDGQLQIILIAIVNSLILLPYILLFTPSAYFSNRFPLIKVMRISAWIAVACGMSITYFYYHGNYHWAFMMTLVLAIQSAIYSPAKYGYIKQLMGEAKLVMANARVQVATIVAILSGTLVFSILFEILLARHGLDASNYSETAIIQAIAPLGWLLIISTGFELVMAYRLPELSQTQAHAAKFDWPSYLKGQTLKKHISAITTNRAILYSILGLSIFWGLSQMVLAAFPAYAKQYLHETNTAIIQAMLACSGVGIFLGSLLVSRLSRRTMNKPLAEKQLRLQMIPFGAVGLAMCLGLVPVIDSKIGLALCFLGVGFFGAYFIVPLNAIIQSLAPPAQTGTILAGNNWFQNISMLSFLALTIISAIGGFNAAWLFYLIAAIAIVGALGYLRAGARDFLQFTLGGIFKLRYKITSKQAVDFPAHGGVLLLGNHVSWIDWALIQLALPRTIYFVIDRDFYEHWLLKPILSRVNTIPISPRRSKEAIKKINTALRAGDVVCLFPEGKISKDGQLNEFKAGYVLAVKNTKAKILPFYLHGMYGSLFSRTNNPKISILSRIFGKKRRVEVALGSTHNDIDAATLQSEVEQLRAQIAKAVT